MANETESLISARLRRLREEADIPFHSHDPQPIDRPGGIDRREKRLSPVDIVRTGVAFDENGRKEKVQVTTTTMRDENAGALEHLSAKGWLRRKEEDPDVAAVRLTTAVRYRSIQDDAQFSGLKGQSYGGSGTKAEGVPYAPADHTLDCIKIMGEIRKKIEAPTLEPVDQVVVKDVWIWEGKKGGAVRKEIDRLLKGIDHLSVYFGSVTIEECRERWAARPPEQKNS